MKRVTVVLSLLSVAGLITLPLGSSAFASTSCTLTTADRIANAALSYEDFDTKGTLRSTYRALANAGCDAASADAAEDYMLHHLDLTNDQRINVLFHEGQARAMAGEERTAAMLIAAARDLDLEPNDGLDWNTYVEGTWAFLVKDRVRLEAASAVLSRRRGKGNAINARVLQDLIACFNRPYKVAYGSSCR